MKQSTSVNLNVHKNYVHMNPKDMPGITILKRMKLQNIVGKKNTTLAGIKMG